MEQYNVVISGEIIEGRDQDEVFAAFENKFKQQADKFFTGTKRVIKKNVDAETASRFKAELDKIGAVCSIEPPLAETDNQQVESSPPAAEMNESAPAPSEPTSFEGYSYKVDGKPDYSFLTVDIPANETLKVEASAMATMDTHVQMKTKMRGGFGRLITGESMFINEFTAQGAGGEIGIAPGPPGDLAHVYLQDETIFLQNSAFVASDMNVAVETKWQGLTKGFFSGESLFLIRCSGKGDLWFNTYGAMIEIDVTQDYVVDTSHIVAFTDGLEYNISKVGGYKSLFFSGEGFVCRFSGQGKVWIQTRNVNALKTWVHPFRPSGRSYWP